MVIAGARLRLFRAFGRNTDDIPAGCYAWEFE